MPDGFGAKETIAHPPRDMWAFLTDFRNAKEWMRGIEGMTRPPRVPWRSEPPLGSRREARSMRPA